jgi:hypothetical protein
MPEAFNTIQKPVFVGAAAQDYICIADMRIATAGRLCLQRSVNASCVSRLETPEDVRRPSA